MKQLFVLRHGHCESNIDKVMNFDPSLKNSLTSLGIMQSRATLANLSKMAFDVIYSSEFPRAIETARIVNEAHNLELKIDSRLNENRRGFEGKKSSFWKEKMKNSNYDFTKRFDGGESFNEMFLRIKDFIDEIKELNYENILIVSHSDPIKAIEGYFNNYSLREIYDRKSLANCEYLEFALD